MKKAIITGATGLVGQAIAKYLASNDIAVLCLGRKNFTEKEIRNSFGSNNINYLQIEMQNILDLPIYIESKGWEVGDECAFYNVAWGGPTKLTDGSLEEQMYNSIYSSNAVKAAKKLNCIKFINVGTLEETFAQDFIDAPKDHPNYNFGQDNYAIAKLASRDMCLLIAYLEKIDYVHTRLSVPLDASLKIGGYISSVLSKIAKGESYDKPNNSQLFDIILLEDVAKAYYLLGLKGKNKADYFIGSGKPKTLGQYFEVFEKSVKGEYISNHTNGSEIYPFNTDQLFNDTLFKLDNKFEDLIKSVK
jgi:nucleoside-diphosphate-sugar epimerase